MILVMGYLVERPRFLGCLPHVQAWRKFATRASGGASAPHRYHFALYGVQHRHIYVSILYYSIPGTVPSLPSACASVAQARHRYHVAVCYTTQTYLGIHMTL